jgi:DNA-directed RNA polymerase subunit RPC12/RpoP
MYECLDCGAEFGTPTKAIEYISDPPDGTLVNICPICGSDDIMEVK